MSPDTPLPNKTSRAALLASAAVPHIQDRQPTPKPAGRSVRVFCQETGISNAWFYELLRKCPDKLEIVKVFSKTVVLTEPREFLESFRGRIS